MVLILVLKKYEDLLNKIDDIKPNTTSELDSLIKQKQVEEGKLHQLRADRDYANSVLGRAESTRAITIAEMKRDIAHNIAQQTKNIERLEKTLADSKQALKDFNMVEYEKQVKYYQELEDALASNDAFDTYMRRELTDEVVDEHIINQFGDIVKIVINDDVPLPEHIKMLAEELRKQFDKIGREEVSIGKMKKSQYDANMLSYVTHILTEDGERFLVKSDKDIVKNMPGFGDEFGIGRIFNDYGISRTMKIFDRVTGIEIENPTIQQLNDFFKEELKGKNAYSDSIAEIYLTRMLKHNELMYDDAYMENMLERFGKDLEEVDIYDVASDSLSKGLHIDRDSKIVINYGMMKRSAHDFTTTELGLNISDDISDYLAYGKEHVLDELTGLSKLDINGQPEVITILEKIGRVANANAVKMKGEYKRNYKICFSDEMARITKNYMKEKYTPEIMKELYTGVYQGIVKNIDISRNLDEIAMPLAELNMGQVKGFDTYHTRLVARGINNVKFKYLNVEKQIKKESIHARKYLNDFVIRYNDIFDTDELKITMEEKLNVKFKSFDSENIKDKDKIFIDNFIHQKNNEFIW